MTEAGFGFVGSVTGPGFGGAGIMVELNRAAFAALVCRATSDNLGLFSGWGMSFDGW
jgi:hypothetical protein